MLDLDYIYTSQLPNDNANSIHVAHFSEALSIEFNFRLFTFLGGTNEDIYHHYAIDNKFCIQKMSKNKYLCILKLLFTNKLKKNIYVRDFFCALLLALCGKRVIWESHVFSDKFIYKLGYKLASLLNLFCKVVVITEALKQKHIKNFDSEKVLVLADGCRVQRKPKCHFSKKTLNIGYVGSFYKGKGVDTVIKIAKELPEHYFKIAGGSKKDIVNATKISSKNVIFAGYLNQKELINFYKDIDVGLLPNKPSVRINNNGQEIGNVTSPLKLFEYFSFGIPIIASDLDVLREVLNKSNSILVNYDDINGWYKAIKQLEDNKLRTELSIKGLEELQDKYSWSKRAEKISKLLQ